MSLTNDADGSVAVGVVIETAKLPVSKLNPLYAIPPLQQDYIGNTKNPDASRARGFVPGRCVAVNNVRVDLWEGPTGSYVFPTVAQQMRITSSSAADALAGTGVQKVEVHYLDNLYNPQTETVSLNGLTPVNMAATNVLRINRFHATQVGTGGVSAGAISLTNMASTVTYGYIAAGNNTARQAVYTIPAGMVGYISHWQGGSGTVTGTHFTQIELRVTADSLELYPGVFLLVDNMATLNNGQAINYPTPIPVPATADVKLSAISDAANAGAVAVGAIMGWFEPA